MASSKLLKWAKRQLRILPDAAYIQLYYFSKFGRFCRLRNPTTYNEKLQWLKLNYRVPEFKKFVDKIDVKQYVSDTIGAQYVIPTLAVYDAVDEIDFDHLPNAFVLKCTHDSEGVALVPDKSTEDLRRVKDMLRVALQDDFYYVGREPYYLGINPRVLAEPYLVDETRGQLLDYKFFCFNGEVKSLYVASDRSSGNVKFDYFDKDFQPLDLRQAYARSSTPPTKPQRFDEMITLAEQLSRGFPHVRVDLYEINGQVFFGEMTFFHFSGFSPFKPAYWDKVWGNWLSLPKPVN